MFRENTRGTVDGIMKDIWKKIDILNDDIQRRVLTSLITELQTALKHSDTPDA